MFRNKVSEFKKNAIVLLRVWFADCLTDSATAAFSYIPAYRQAGKLSNASGSVIVSGITALEIV
jgi:hypothetical protein